VSGSTESGVEAGAAPRSLWADWSTQAALQGLVVAVVGYASSVAVVVQGLAAMGATTAQIASALLFLGLAKGVVAIGLSLHARLPISIAWTTPGLALLAVTAQPSGGFGAAVGAFIVTGLLIVVAGLWPVLGRLVRAIPGSVASAMLAGILLKLCLAPLVALQSLPLSAGAVILVWLAMMRFYRLYAVPAAVAAALVIIGLQPGGGGSAALVPPTIIWVTPVFDLEAIISIAIPLFVVTMASQNITGLAVLATFGFRPDPRPGLAATGLASVGTAPFGAPTINYAAITAALCAGTDAHPDPARRYVAAVMSGVGYILLAALAGVAATVVTRSPPLLIETIAGLALISAFAGAVSAAVGDEKARLPAMIAFLVTASGLTIGGVGAAFWGLVAGWLIHLVFVPPAAGPRATA
jgi:benzoate membrane transport protein